MSPLPEEYHRDRERIDRQILRSADPANHRHGPVISARTVNAAVLAFLERWESRPEVAAEQAYLAKQREMLEQMTERLEAMYQGLLAELLGHRQLCLANEEAIAAGSRIMAEIREAPPARRAEFQESLRQRLGPNLNLEAELKRLRAKSKQDALSFRQLLEEYESDWPDRMKDPFYRRILTMSSGGYEAMAAELEVRRKRAKRRSEP